jgi:hypothetical protein
MKPQLILDPVPVCKCHYCKSSDIREWLQPRLKATAKAGHPRPQISTIHGILLQEFGAARISIYPQKAGDWMKRCEPLWEALWDADGKPRDNGSA